MLCQLLASSLHSLWQLPQCLLLWIVWPWLTVAISWQLSWFAPSTMICNCDNVTLARKQGSSIRRLSVLNFRNSLRVHGVGATIGGGAGPRSPQRRKPKDWLPSHMSVMGVIMKFLLPMCGPDGMDRFEFKRRFEMTKKKNLKKDGSAMSDANLLDWWGPSTQLFVGEVALPWQLLSTTRKEGKPLQIHDQGCYP